MARIRPHHEEEAAAAAARLSSDVWENFDRSTTGGAATATCRRCGCTLSACSRNGTSHLRRHTASRSCRTRAEEPLPQLTPPTAAERPSPGDQECSISTVAADEDEEKFGFLDGVNIPDLFDELRAQGLVFIDHGSEAVGAGHAHSGPSYVPVPQAATSSSRRFFQKTKERKKKESKKRCAPDDFGDDDLSAQRSRLQLQRKEDVTGWSINSASHQGGATDGETAASKDHTSANIK